MRHSSKGQGAGDAGKQLRLIKVFSVCASCPPRFFLEKTASEEGCWLVLLAVHYEASYLSSLCLQERRDWTGLNVVHM